MSHTKQFVTHLREGKADSAITSLAESFKEAFDQSSKAGFTAYLIETYSKLVEAKEDEKKDDKGDDKKKDDSSSDKKDGKNTEEK